MIFFSSLIQGNHLALSELIFLFLIVWEIRIINYSFYHLSCANMIYRLMSFFWICMSVMGFFNTYHFKWPVKNCTILCVCVFFFISYFWIVLLFISQPYLYCLRIFHFFFLSIYVYVSPCIWCVYFLSFFSFLIIFTL